MFDIGWGEFLVIGIVALIVIGPKELPGVLRTLGQGMSKIRRMASEFQGQFNEAMREAEMHDLKKEVDELSAAARGFQYYDPMNPDGLEPKAETKPVETVELPAPEETPALPPPEESSTAALPEPDLVPAEPPKPDEKPGEGRAS
jgi:sec-independent protein translocase protein TatB